MKELLTAIVKALVDYPDAVNITEIEGERTVVYELRVDKADLGKVIGREGRMARAIRSIVAAAALKQGKRAMVEIIE
ncbi:KH domain-containing protein [candidate division WOR-3 bacterium]|nr:KH domain-containing protein [candidate division WOR-3 bacterium]